MKPGATSAILAPTMKPLHPPSADHQPIACNLGAFTPEQRSRRQALAQELQSLIREVRPLDNGYEGRFDPDNLTLLKLAEFVGVERRCCPFITFEVVVNDGAGPILLRLTGRPGTKEFLAGWLGA